MKKRGIGLFLSLLLACLCLPLAGCGHSDTLTVGVCNYVDDASLDLIASSLIDELCETARRRGETVRIEYRNAGADPALMNQIVAGFLSEGVDVMVGIATPVALSMQAAVGESGIPVVFSAVSDPLGAGLVESMDHPGGALTGTSDGLDTASLLRLMLAVDPGLTRVGLLWDPGQDASTAPVAEARTYFADRGIAVVEKTGHTIEEIGQAAGALVTAGVGAVFSPTDNSVMTAELAIAETFAAAGIPHYAGADSFALNGAFLGYGVNYAELGRVTGEMVAEILWNGTAPADMAVRTFDNGTATVNTETAARLGLDPDALTATLSPLCMGVQTTVTGATFADAAVPHSVGDREAFFRLSGADLVSAAELGLIFGLVVLALFLSYSQLGICDLSTDGNFTLGAAVAAAVAVAGHPGLSLLGSLAAGAAVGLVTALLQTKLGVNSLLAGILVNTALFSVNMQVMGGRSYLSLYGTETVFSRVRAALAGTFLSGAADLLCAGLFALVCAVLLFGFLHTRMGLAVRATGDNPDMVRASSVNPALTTVVGLCISGAMTGLSGGLLAQYQATADVNMGTGTVTVALASLLIGQVLLGRRGMAGRIAGMVLGAVIFRGVYAVALGMNMPAHMLKAVSAAVVVVTVCVPYLRRQAPTVRRYLEGRGARRRTEKQPASDGQGEEK